MKKIILGLFLFAAACGNSFGKCDLKSQPKEDACDPGITPDSTAKACKDSTGAAFICRNGLGYCVICTGGSFSDGCTVTNNGTDSYCIHDCGDC